MLKAKANDLPIVISNCLIGGNTHKRFTPCTCATSEPQGILIYLPVGCWNIISNTYDSEKECWVIKFDGDVTTIGEWAFYACSSLTSVTIPDSVTTIGCEAFSGCSSITSVTIPDSVTTIGLGAFACCSKLREFNGKYASEDGRCLIIDGTLNSFAIGCGVTEYTIPDSVTTIGLQVFSHCSSLTSVTIPDSVTSIGEGAFYECSSLTSVTIPDSVTKIGIEAFFNCTNLKNITIPDSVTSIEYSAFSLCSSLTSVTIGDSVQKTISTHTCPYSTPF